MPVPFEPFDTGNAVSAEFLKLYKENPKNTAIPADILAILQNQESLEPPTIIRQAPTSAFERTIFSSEAPITGKINSPYQPIINEIVKDPQLLHNIPLDDLNKLILESTQQYATPAKIQNLPQANNFKLLSAPQKSGQPFQNINDLQKLRIVAAKKNSAPKNRKAGVFPQKSGLTIQAFQILQTKPHKTNGKSTGKNWKKNPGRAMKTRQSSLREAIFTIPVNKKTSTKPLSF